MQNTHTMLAPPQRIPDADGKEDAHTGHIYSVAMSPRFLVTGSQDRTVRVWSRASKALALPPLTGHQSSVLSIEVLEEIDLICSGDANGRILLWRLSTGDLLQTVKAHDDTVLGFSRDARTLLSASKDRTAKVWRIVGCESGEIGLSCRHTLVGHEFPILAVRLLGDTIVTASRGGMKIWSVEDGSCLRAISDIASMCRFAVLGGSENSQIVGACTDGHVRLYDLASGSETACLTGHVGVVRSVKVLASPSSQFGHKIISGGYDGTVRVWSQDAATGVWQCERVFSFSDALLTPLGDEIEETNVEDGEYLSVQLRAKRVFDMQVDGSCVYAVGQGAEIVAFDLDAEEAGDER